MVTQNQSRIGLVDPKNTDGGLRDLFEVITKSRGQNYVANVFRALGNSPGALETVAGVGKHVRYQTEIDDQLRELLILTVAQEINNSYEWTHHYLIAKRIGVDEEILLQIGTSDLEERLGLRGDVLRFVRLVANNQAVDDKTIMSVSKQFGEKGLVDVTLLASYYVMLGLCLNVWHVPCEVELIPFSRAS